jgi:hypothetical protein
VPEHMRDDEGVALPAPLLEEPTSDEPVDKIMEGIDVSPFGPGPLVWLLIWQGSGYSEIKGCSGMLIGPHHVLTAAHCFPGNGYRPVTVTAISSSNDPFCLFGWGTDCDTKPPSSTYGYRHPSFSGSGDTDNDVAIFDVGGDWNVSPYDQSATFAARFAQSVIAAGHQVRFWGWGHTAHTGFTAGERPRVTMQDVGVDWANSGHFNATVVSGEGRTCKGDSGGPATSINYAGSQPVIVGIHSNATEHVGWCPPVGATTRKVNIGNRDGWVKDTVESTGGDCSFFTSGGSTNLYWRCF